jgi:hypothetical protein
MVDLLQFGNWGRISWLWFEGLVALVVIINLLWARVVLMRANEIKFDEHLAKYWPDGTQRDEPVKLDKARARRESWGKLAVPLTLLYFAMVTTQFAYMSAETYAKWAMFWFLTAPIRRTAGIAASRRAYRRNPKNPALQTSLLRDVWDYYRVGLRWVLHLPTDKVRKQPSFLGITRRARFYNKVHGWLQVRSIWRIATWPLRAVAVLLGYTIISWLWLIAAPIAIFYYMDEVEDYAFWRQPKWRLYRASDSPYNRRTGGPVIDGEVVTKRDNPPDEAPSGVLRDPVKRSH